MIVPKCIPGCKHFTGGEVKHHKDCPNYKDSLSEYYDKMENIAIKFAEWLDGCGYECWAGCHVWFKKGSTVENSYVDGDPSKEFLPGREPKTTEELYSDFLKTL